MYESSFRLGRLAGVEIGIHYSLIFLGGLLVLSMSDGYYPTRLPHLTESQTIGLAVLTALLFFASIIWHEMAHALTAKLFNLPVKRIVLNMIGGMAEIEGEPRTPFQDFAIAFAGPFSTAVLGGLFLGTTLFVSDSTAMGNMLLWLGGTNLLLAGLNIIPSFPLDGGRVLRAIIWGITGNYWRATQGAVRIGQFFAACFFIFGWMEIFLLGSAFSGMWTIFIAWFLWSAARGQLQHARRQHTLSDIPLRSVLRPRVNLQSDWSLIYAMDMMSMNGSGSIAPVMQDDKMVGIFSLEAVLLVPRINWGTISVGSLMHTLIGIPHLSIESNLFQTLAEMERRAANFVIITRADTEPIGIASRYDLLKALEHHQVWGG